MSWTRFHVFVQSYLATGLLHSGTEVSCNTFKKIEKEKKKKPLEILTPDL